MAGLGQPRPAILRVSKSELRDLVGLGDNGVPGAELDEMAVPSYLHWNPLIPWLMWRRYEVISEFARISGEMAVLEFGCGVGNFLPEMAARTSRVWALDQEPRYAMALAEKRGLRVEFVCSIDEIMEDSLDVIIAADVLEHIEDLGSYLRGFSRALKTGGRLIVSGPTENLFYRIGRSLAGFGGKGDYHHSNIDQVNEKIGEAGFELRRIRTLPFKLGPVLFKVAEFVKTGG